MQWKELPKNHEGLEFVGAKVGGNRFYSYNIIFCKALAEYEKQLGITVMDKRGYGPKS